jgi:hypothetical protein
MEKMQADVAELPPVSLQDGLAVVEHTLFPGTTDGEATVPETVPPKSATMNRRSSLKRLAFEGTHWALSDDLGTPRGEADSSSNYDENSHVRPPLASLADPAAMLAMLRKATLDSHKLLHASSTDNNHADEVTQAEEVGGNDCMWVHLSFSVVLFQQPPNICSGGVAIIICVAI